MKETPFIHEVGRTSVDYTDFRKILDGLGDIVFVKGLDGSYLSVNESFEKVVGRTRQQLIGTSDAGLLPDHHLAVVRAKEELLLREGHPVEYEMIYERDGDSRFLKVRKQLLRDEHGCATAIIGTARDVTSERAAENKYRFIFDNAPIAFWEEDFSRAKVILDEIKARGVQNFRKHFKDNPDDLHRCIESIRIKDVNLATMRMNRVNDKPQFIAELKRTFTQDSQSVFLDEFVALAEGKTIFRSEASTIDVGGERLDVLFHLNVLPGHEHDLSVVLVSVIDVTPLKRTESELSRVKELYRSVVEGQQEMICRFLPMGRITFLNGAFGEFFSDQLERKQNVSFLELFPRTDHTDFFTQFACLDPSSPVCSFETHNYAPDGRLVWQRWSVTALFSIKGEATEYQAVGTDITERKETEEALASSEARWRSVFDSAHDLIITINNQGLILSANSVASRAAGIQLAGKMISDVLSQQNEQRAREVLSAVFEQGTRTEIELKVSAGPNEGNTLNCVITPVRYQDRVLSATVIARDVTATRRMENRIREALIEGQENERKRVSRELHDGLGQLFTAIRLNFEHLESSVRKEANDETRIRMSNLEKNIKMAIEEVKGISHNLMPDLLEQFGLEAAMRDLISNWSNDCAANLSLEVVDLRNGLPEPVSLSLYRMAQELITNAVRHSGAANIFVQLIDHGDTVMLMVEDDGSGFDPDSEQIGLGLRNIRSRAELLEGTVDIDSYSGRGTVTTVEIPLLVRSI